jgi:hypothetical protein
MCVFYQIEGQVGVLLATVEQTLDALARAVES